jgi:hypothetical protein
LRRSRDETLPTGKASRGGARAAPNKALVTGRACFPLTAVARWIAARHRLLAVCDGHFGMGFRTSTHRFSSREVVAWCALGNPSLMGPLADMPTLIRIRLPSLSASPDAMLSVSSSRAVLLAHQSNLSHLALHGLCAHSLARDDVRQRAVFSAKRGLNCATLDAQKFEISMI